MEKREIISSMAMAFVESNSLLIAPPKVATIYRIASKTVLIPDLSHKLFAEVVLISLDAAIYTAACLIQNDENEPSPKLIKRIERTYTAKQLSDVVSHGLNGITVDHITALYDLGKKPGDKQFVPTKADSVIHRQIGSFIKHFGISEYEAKFKMTWQNYLLYMNSIPSEETESQKDGNGQIPFEGGKHNQLNYINEFF